MSPRRLALALAAAWLASGSGVALAGPRAASAAGVQVAQTEPQVAAKPAAKPAAPAALGCRRYVPAAGMTIAVACPAPAPGAEPPPPSVPEGANIARWATDRVPPAGDVKPAEVKPAEVRTCRRYLPSIGETIAVTCDDADGARGSASGPSSDAAAASHQRAYVVAQSPKS